MLGGDTLEADGTMAQPRACKPAHESFARAARSAPSQRVEDSFVAAVAISPAAPPHLAGQPRHHGVFQNEKLVPAHGLTWKT